MTRLTATHAASPPRRERGSRTARRFMSASGSERLEASGPHRALGGPERSSSSNPRHSRSPGDPLRAQANGSRVRDAG
jgi:hypothetical protein